jgi:O-antigen/teichoic acid export membrane protein
LSIGGVARGGLFLFTGVVVSALLGYVYWFLVSQLSGAEVVGIANSILSLSSLVSGIAILGVPTGVQRFLGKEFSRNNVRSLNTYFWTSFIFTLLLSLFSAVLIWVISFLNVSFIGFSENMLFLSGTIVLLSFSVVMSALFTSIIRTEFTAISNVGSSITKLSLGIFLVYLGFGWLGAIMGIILSSFFLMILMLFFTYRELRRLGGVKISLSAKALRESLHAGLVSWLPGVVGLLGQQLGILMLYGNRGGSEAGIFYIALAIFSLVYMLPASFMSILFPVLSGLAEEGKRTAWKALKVCLALACPLSVFLILYAGFPLSLVGKDYIQAAPTLSLLALSIVPLTFVSAVTNLVYAYGSYGKALGIGLAVNVPQVMLYFILIPIYGEYGVALSYVAGAIIGTGVAAYVSKTIMFQVSIKEITIAVMTPLGAALLCFVTRLDWLIGGTTILLVSVLCYGRAGVVERSDLAEIARAFASENTIVKASKRLNWLLRIVYGG